MLVYQENLSVNKELRNTHRHTHIHIYEYEIYGMNYIYKTGNRKEAVSPVKKRKVSDLVNEVGQTSSLYKDKKSWSPLSQSIFKLPHKRLKT